MGLTYLIEILLIGLIAGWLAGKVMRGRGYGIVVDIIVSASTPDRSSAGSSWRSSGQ
jgi:hypothetical protein